MNADRTSRAIAALATPQARALLGAIKDSGWYIASAAASRAKVHVSTATKHLTILHEAGLLQRKEVRTATGRTFAYRLPRPTITLTLELASDRKASGGSAEAALRLLREVVRKGEALAGRKVRAKAVEILQGSPSSGRAPSGADGAWERLSSGAGDVPEGQVIDALRGVGEFLDSTLGPLVTERIVLAAVEDAGGRGTFPWLSRVLRGRAEVTP